MGRTVSGLLHDTLARLRGRAAAIGEAERILVLLDVLHNFPVDPTPGGWGDLENSGRGGKACRREPQTDSLPGHGLTVPTPPILCQAYPRRYTPRVSL